MPSTAQLTFVIPISIIVIDTIRRLFQSRRERNGLPLLPGPTPGPFLGNALSINLEEPWKTYTDWHAKYGDILHLKLLDQDVIVIGSESVAVELLEKRSQIYSDRPFVATIEAYDADCNFAFAPYGDHWRFCRRIFHQTFHADAALSFRPMQLRRARELVVNMIEIPDRHHSHFSTFATAVAMSAAYDYNPSPRDDPIVHIIEEYAAAAVPAVTPEQATLLRLFPFLLHIPDWFPGSALKREARRARDLAAQMVELPYYYAKEHLEASQERTAMSMVADHMGRMQKHDESHRAVYDQALKKAAVTSILASAETTASSLMVFTLAMVLHPHTWKRAQAEIDGIVGTARLPNFDDRPSLPYVEAVVRESVWHATSGEDIYDGHYIPKGATVVANAWAMSRDETRFPHAEEFIPERFLTEDGTLTDNDHMDFVFGFGRRICPGRHTADASLWASIVTLLATLDFCLPRDVEGSDVVFEPKYLNGLTHRPDAFPCHVVPRAHVTMSFLERVVAS